MTDEHRGPGRPRLTHTTEARKARDNELSVVRVRAAREGTTRRTVYLDTEQAARLDRLVAEHGTPSAAVEAAAAHLTKT